MLLSTFEELLLSTFEELLLPFELIMAEEFQWAESHGLSLGPV
jgi:hypothetical protein